MKYWVTLLKKPVVDGWKEGYFPRALHYLDDARRLAEEVKSKGGLAKITHGGREVK